jgi:hypothetical protein
MEIPHELAAVFRRHPEAKAKFDNYGPSHQKEYVQYVAEAKKPATRQNRADRVVIMLTGNKLQTVYKPKTIPEVFGLKSGMKSLIVNRPDNYNEIMGNWKFDLAKDNLDFMHLFVKKQADLAQLPNLKSQLKPAGMIWVSWLKKSSGIPTDVTEKDIRQLALELGLVDIKVCAVSDIWSGLKLVIPVAER